MRYANGILGLGGEIVWPKPTRPGDMLRVESEIAEITPSRSKPHQGIVTNSKHDAESKRRSSLYTEGQASGTAAPHVIVSMSPSSFGVTLNENSVLDVKFRWRKLVRFRLLMNNHLRLWFGGRSEIESEFRGL